MAVVAPRWVTIRLTLPALLAVAVAGCSSDESGETSTDAPPTTNGAPAQLVVTSAAFGEGDTVPVEHTCDGADVSPPLSIGEIPEDAVSLVVLAEDPDAPGGTFDHWVSYDADVAGELPAGVEPGTAGTNSFGLTGYRGPCPPSGDPHRYVFTVLALDSELGLAEGQDKTAVLDAAASRILAEGSLTGLYGR